MRQTHIHRSSILFVIESDSLTGLVAFLSTLREDRERKREWRAGKYS